MRQGEAGKPAPKFDARSLVKVVDVNSPFYGWVVEVELAEYLRHSGRQPGKGALVEMTSWFYYCCHNLVLRAEVGALRLTFREDQLQEVPF